MGVFVNYEPLPFANISNTPVTLLATDSVNIPHTIIVNGISVTNTTNQTIRFNLKKNRQQTSPISIFRVNEFEIKPYQTIDVVVFLELQLVLKYSATPSITENLVCYSNSPSQKFDCEITFTVLNETPIY
jgi:hypothetical protein